MCNLAASGRGWSLLAHARRREAAGQCCKLPPRFVAAGAAAGISHGLRS